jgi:hypothetical protein
MIDEPQEHEVQAAHQRSMAALRTAWRTTLARREEQKPVWAALDAALGDRFWAAPLQDGIARVGRHKNNPIKAYNNSVAPWVLSFLARLFYTEPKISAKPPAVFVGDAQPPREQAAAAVAALGEQWLRAEDVRSAVRQVVQLGLLGGRVRAGVRASAERRPADAVRGGRRCAL